MHDHVGPWGSRRIAAWCPASKSIEPVRIEAPCGPAGQAHTGDVVCETCDRVLLTLSDTVSAGLEAPGDVWGRTLAPWAGRVLAVVCQEEEGAVQRVGLDAPRAMEGHHAAGDFVCQACLSVLLTIFDADGAQLTLV